MTSSGAGSKASIGDSGVGGLDRSSSSTGWTMRRALVLGLLFLAGCQNTTGPLANRNRDRADNPYYNAEEQKQRGRDRYPLPDDSPLVGPNTGNSTYGPTGR
jgi:hypothetical protein